MPYENQQTKKIVIQSEAKNPYFFARASMMRVCAKRIAKKDRTAGVPTNQAREQRATKYACMLKRMLPPSPSLIPQTSPQKCSPRRACGPPHPFYLKTRFAFGSPRHLASPRRLTKINKQKNCHSERSEESVPSSPSPRRLPYPAILTPKNVAPVVPYGPPCPFYLKNCFAFGSPLCPPRPPR